MRFAPITLLLAVALVGCGSTEEAADAVARKAEEAKAGIQETAAAGFDGLKDKLIEQTSGLEGQLGELKELAAKANDEQVNGLIAEAETKILSIKERATEFASSADPKALVAELGGEVEEVTGLLAKIKDLLSKLPGIGQGR